MYCKNCGQELKETARFCTKCGKVIKSTGGFVPVNNYIHRSRMFEKKRITADEIQFILIALAELVFFTLGVAYYKVESPTKDEIPYETSKQYGFMSDAQKLEGTWQMDEGEWQIEFLGAEDEEEGRAVITEYGEDKEAIYKCYESSRRLEIKLIDKWSVLVTENIFYDFIDDDTIQATGMDGEIIGIWEKVED